MITFADTNALIAFVLKDRSFQRAAVTEHVEHNGPLVVSESILAETYWVLVRTYAQDPVEVAQALRQLLFSSTFRAWDADVAHAALVLLVRQPSLGLPDCLLVARAELGDAVFTFDRRLPATIEQL